MSKEFQKQSPSPPPSPIKGEGEKNSIYLAFGIYGAIGFQLAASVIAGLLIGNWLDKKLSTAPWLAVLGLTLGFAGGLWNMIRILNWHRNKSE